MKRKVLLLLLIVTIFLTGCMPTYENDCRETCESKNYSYHKYIYICYGTDICLCKNIEGEIENVW